MEGDALRPGESLHLQAHRPPADLRQLAFEVVEFGCERAANTATLPWKGSPGEGDGACGAAGAKLLGKKERPAGEAGRGGGTRWRGRNQKPLNLYADDATRAGLFDR